MSRERWLIGVMALMACVQIILGALLLNAYSRVKANSHRLVYLEHKELCTTTADCDALLQKTLSRTSPRERRAIAAVIASARRSIVAATVHKEVMRQHQEHPGQHPGPVQGPPVTTTAQQPRTPSVPVPLPSSPKTPTVTVPVPSVPLPLPKAPTVTVEVPPLP